MKILLAEDNALLGKSLKRGMEELGWTVDLATDGDEAAYCARSGDYNVMILDWMLPKCSGLELLKSLRTEGQTVPTIMITAKGAVADRVEGLNGGADDYIVKPFEFVEMVARVNALYRRSLGQATSKLVVGDLVIDIASHQVALGDRQLDMTAMEYDLVAALAAKCGRLVSRDALGGVLYQLDGQPDSNSLDVVLARVRKKLAGSDVEIATIRGKGFILRVAQAPS